MKNFLRNNWITLALSVAFVASAVLAVRNYYIIKEHQISLHQTDLVKQTTQAILTRIMHGLDLGVRGFGLTKDEQLLIPYREAIEITPGVFHRIDSLLTIQNYPKRQEALSVMAEINSYIQFSNHMIELARQNSDEEFVELLREDRGYNVWKKYDDFSSPLFSYQDELASQSLKDYETAIQGNLFLQFAILILGLPMVLMFVRRVNVEKKRRETTLKEVDHTDREYVFNTGEETETFTEEINERAVKHIKEASTFITALANGNYDVTWSGLSKSNLALNEKTLAGNLFRLRDRLTTVKMEDERRHWVNEGLAAFTEIVRTYQDDDENLGIKTISFLTKYINAQQGSLFIAEEHEGETVLRLRGCYAFDKRKFVEKTIEPGNGIIGQVYLEGEPVLMKEVPNGYTHITSGLGDATPSCISVIPLKQDSKVICIVEFASFSEIRPHQIMYLQKAGEFLASAISTNNTSREMKRLLTEASAKEANMRQKEEELRQNMEELQATQEQLQRTLLEQSKNRELEVA